MELLADQVRDRIDDLARLEFASVELAEQVTEGRADPQLDPGHFEQLRTVMGTAPDREGPTEGRPAILAGRLLDGREDDPVLPRRGNPRSHCETHRSTWRLLPLPLTGGAGTEQGEVRHSRSSTSLELQRPDAGERIFREKRLVDASEYRYECCGQEKS